MKKQVKFMIKIIGKFTRTIFRNPIDRHRLKNDNFTIICQNCRGGNIYNDLGKKFLSPMINLYMFSEDLVKFCENMDHYMEEKFIFIDSDLGHPVGLLDDIKIYFNHDTDPEIAEKKWWERCQRIKRDNMYIMMIEFRECTKDILDRFDKLPYKKVIFTANKYDDIESSIYVPGYEEQGYVGYLGTVSSVLGTREDEKYFDFIKWLNS